MSDLRRKLDYKLLGYPREAVHYLKGLAGGHKHQSHFVIFGRGRSGSTLLVDLLSSGDRIFCDTEILNRPVLSPFHHIRNCSRMHPAEIYGFKLLSYQLQSVQNLSDPKAFLDKLVREKGYQLIFLTRENLLRQTLSKHYANFRNAWHDKGKSNDRSKMTVDIPLLISHLDAGYALGQFEEKMLNNLPCLRLTYENDLSEPDKQRETITKVTAYLGTDDFEPKTNLRRITSNAYSDFIENFEKLERALENTRYADFLKQ